jgi:hypothetical protein
MKKLLLITIATLALAACKKGTAPTPSPNIIGKWELHERIGGNITPADSTYKPGNGNVYQFNSDSTYKQYVNGSLSSQGTFHVRNQNPNNANQTNYKVLYFDSDVNFSYLFGVNQNVLTLQPQIPDIGTQEYEKLSD